MPSLSVPTGELCRRSAPRPVIGRTRSLYAGASRAALKVGGMSFLLRAEPEVCDLPPGHFILCHPVLSVYKRAVPELRVGAPEVGARRAERGREVVDLT